VALLPSPGRVLSGLQRLALASARRLLGITPEPPGELRKVPDDLPRDQLYAQPLLSTVSVKDPEPVEGGTRVAFRVVVKDANGRRCSDIAVEARITGPERSASAQVTTDMLGSALFRMTGPPGSYAFELLDVAAFALDWDRDASDLTATRVVT